jgi:tRNA pseudouridine38-40 synthase
VSTGPRRVRIDLAYDGTDFAGWQVQPNARTVQGVLESALARIHDGRPAGVRGAGRTDAGVHARGQVADAQVRHALDDERLTRALRALVAPDVSVIALRTVGDSFNARRDAVQKTYRYLLDFSPHADPFLRRFAWHQPWRIDRPALDAALRRLPGRRDWAGFAGSACEVSDTVRDLRLATFEELPGGQAAFTFAADGFLNHMVRNLVGTLLDIARGRFAPERIDEILVSRDRRLAGATAPARGLCLERVEYPPGADDRMRERGI